METFGLVLFLFIPKSTGDTGDNSTTGCLSKFPAVVVDGEHRSGCDYYNGDSKSWRSMRLICGGGKKKTWPFLYGVAVNLKRHINMRERTFQWRRIQMVNGKKGLLLFQVQAIIYRVGDKSRQMPTLGVFVRHRANMTHGYSSWV